MTTADAAGGGGARPGGAGAGPSGGGTDPGPSLGDVPAAPRRGPRVFVLGCAGVILAGLIGLAGFAYVTFRAVVTDPLAVREQALEILPIAIPRECEGQLAVQFQGLRFAMLGDIDGPKPLQIVLASAPAAGEREANRKRLEERISRKGRYKLRKLESHRQTFTYRGREVEALVYPSEYEGRQLIQYEVFIDHAGREVILGLGGLPKELDHARVQAILDGP